MSFSLSNQKLFIYLVMYKLDYIFIFECSGLKKNPILQTCVATNFNVGAFIHGRRNYWADL